MTSRPSAPTTPSVTDAGAISPRTLYAIEKKRRASGSSGERERNAWADAERQFEAWYQNLGTRVDLVTGGYAGIHRERTLATRPKCFCGKATKAVGLCVDHYHALWKRYARRLRGVKRDRDQRAICHPGRPHHAKGLCKRCSQTAYRHSALGRARRRLERIARKTGKPTSSGRRLAWRCPHRSRLNHARGLCAACYNGRLAKGQGFAALPKTRRGVRRRVVCGHPGRKHKSRGMCDPCYQAWKRRASGRAGRQSYHAKGLPLKCGHPANTKPSKDGAVRRHLDGWCLRCARKRRARPEIRRRAACHPGKPHNDNGLCGACSSRAGRLATRERIPIELARSLVLEEARAGRPLQTKRAPGHTASKRGTRAIVPLSRLLRAPIETADDFDSERIRASAPARTTDSRAPV